MVRSARRHCALPKLTHRLAKGAVTLPGVGGRPRRRVAAWRRNFSEGQFKLGGKARKFQRPAAGRSTQCTTHLVSGVRLAEFFSRPLRLTLHAPRPPGLEPMATALHCLALSGGRTLEGQLGRELGQGKRVCAACLGPGSTIFHLDSVLPCCPALWETHTAPVRSEQTSHIAR